jgi:hypothetical protein
MRTEFAIEGADCGACLNDTLEHLRGLPAVRSVHASSSDGCLVVEHDAGSPQELVDAMRQHLHGTFLASNEIVMDDVVPTIAIRSCTH